MGLFVSNNSLV